MVHGIGREKFTVEEGLVEKNTAALRMMLYLHKSGRALRHSLEIEKR